VTEQLSVVVKKLPYGVYLARHFQECAIRRLSTCARVPH